jgi:hypothetical protein
MLATATTTRSATGPGSEATPQTTDSQAIVAARKTFIAFRQAEEEKNWDKVKELNLPDSKIVLLLTDKTSSGSTSAGAAGVKTEMGLAEWRQWTSTAPDPNQGPIFYEDITFKEISSEGVGAGAEVPTVEVRGIRKNQNPSIRQDGQFYMRMRGKGTNSQGEPVMLIDHHAWEPASTGTEPRPRPEESDPAGYETLPPISPAPAEAEAITIRGKKSQDLDAVTAYLWKQIAEETKGSRIDPLPALPETENQKERIVQAVLIETPPDLPIPKISLISARLIPTPELSACKILMTRRPLAVTPEGTVPGWVMEEGRRKASDLLLLLPSDRE